MHSVSTTWGMQHCCKGLCWVASLEIGAFHWATTHGLTCEALTQSVAFVRPLINTRLLVQFTPLRVRQSNERGSRKQTTSRTFDKQDKRRKHVLVVFLCPRLSHFSNPKCIHTKWPKSQPCTTLHFLLWLTDSAAFVRLHLHLTLAEM